MIIIIYLCVYHEILSFVSYPMGPHINTRTYHTYTLYVHTPFSITYASNIHTTIFISTCKYIISSRVHNKISQSTVNLNGPY